MAIKWTTQLNAMSATTNYSLTAAYFLYSCWIMERLFFIVQVYCRRALWRWRRRRGMPIHILARAIPVRLWRNSRSILKLIIFRITVIRTMCSNWAAAICEIVLWVSDNKTKYRIYESALNQEWHGNCWMIMVRGRVVETTNDYE